MEQENSLFSVRVERHTLAGLLKHPEIYSDIDGFLNEYDYYNKANQVIFSIIKGLNLDQKSVDKVIIGQKVKELGISLGIDVFEYLESLASTSISAKATMEAAKKLVELRIRREILATSNNINEYVQNSPADSIDKVLSNCDKIYNEKISSYNLSLKPIDVFAGFEEMLNERSKKPVDEMGLMTPYQNYNKMFGGFRPGNLYCFASRAGVGKSSLLNDLAYKSAILNNCKVLILDTENLTDDIKFRLYSSITQIPCWYLETGNFSKVGDFNKKLQEKKPLLNKLKELVYHIQVSGKHTNEIISLIRRWYLKEVGRGGKCMVIYDYIKLTGEKDANKKEYELIGEKVNRLKELSVELHVPILTANQLNRSAESGIDDSSAMSQSDRLSWFASYVGIFRRKSLEEIGDHGPKFGTHLLITTKGRMQGKDSPGHSNLVRIPQKGGKFKYKENFINFRVENFNVEECGTLADIAASMKEIHDIDEKDDKDDGSI